MRVLSVSQNGLYEGKFVKRTERVYPHFVQNVDKNVDNLLVSVHNPGSYAQIHGRQWEIQQRICTGRTQQAAGYAQG